MLRPIWVEKDLHFLVRDTRGEDQNFPTVYLSGELPGNRYH
uniref:Uncharacterized protein n=1 Tax=Rhizophora mucronata TaxID=61149 RepID=A0A2P2PL20_RHIMU